MSNTKLWADKVVDRIKAKIEAKAYATVILTHHDEEDFGPDCWEARAVGETDEVYPGSHMSPFKTFGDGWGAGPTIALDNLAKALGIDLDADTSTEQHSSTSEAA